MSQENTFINPITGLPEKTEKLRAELDNPFLFSSGTYNYDIDPRDFGNIGRVAFEDPNLIDKRYANQSWGETAGHGLARFGLTTATKFMETLGFIGGLPLSIADSEMAFDNAWIRAFEELEEGVKELFPVYHSSDMDKKNFFEKLGKIDYWSDEVADGAAFMTSAILGGYGAGVLAKGIGNSAKLARTFSTMARASKLGKSVDLGVKASKALKIFAQEMPLIGMTTYQSLGEAGFEGRDTMKQIESQLEGQINPTTNKVYTQEEIKEKALQGAWGTWRGNMALLMVTNYIGNRILFGSSDLRKPIGTSGLGDELFQGGKLVSQAPVKSMWKEMGKSTIQGIANEGFEEGMQLAIQNYRVNKAVKGDNRNSFMGTMENFFDNFSTKEGWEAMGLGALLGAFGGVYGGYSEAKNYNKNMSALHNTFTNSIRAFEALHQDEYVRNEDGTIQTETIKNEKGEDVEILKRDPLKAKEKIEAVFNTINDFVEYSQAVKKFGENSDIAKVYQHRQLASTVYDFLSNGASVDAIKQFIEIEKEAALEQYRNDGNTEAITSVENTYKRYEKTVERLANAYDNIQLLYGGKTLGNSVEAQQYKKILERLQFEGVSHLELLNSVKEEKLKDLNSLTSKTIEGEKEVYTNPLESIVAKMITKELEDIEKGITKIQEEQRKYLNPEQNEKDFIEWKKDVQNYGDFLRENRKLEDEGITKETSYYKNGNSISVDTEEKDTIKVGEEKYSRKEMASKQVAIKERIENASTKEELLDILNNELLYDGNYKRIQNKLKELSGESTATSVDIDKYVADIIDTARENGDNDVAILAKLKALSNGNPKITESQVYRDFIKTNPTAQEAGFKETLEFIENTIIPESDKFTRNKDKKVYLKEKEVYSRNTTFLKGEVTGEGNELFPTATYFGKKFDRLARDFFANEVKTKENGELDYDFATQEQLEQMLQDLQAFKSDLENKGLKAYVPKEREDELGIIVGAEITTDNGEKVRVAGELDLLLYDALGNLYISDFKTIRNIDNYIQNFKDEKTKEVKKSKRDADIEQLSLYRILLRNMTPNARVSNQLYIYGSRLFYNAGDTVIKEYNKSKVFPELAVNSVTDVTNTHTVSYSKEMSSSKKAVLEAIMFRGLGYQRGFLEGLTEAELDHISENNIKAEEYMPKTYASVGETAGGQVVTVGNKVLVTTNKEVKGIETKSGLTMPLKYQTNDKFQFDLGSTNKVKIGDTVTAKIEDTIDATNGKRYTSVGIYWNGQLIERLKDTPFSKEVSDRLMAGEEVELEIIDKGVNSDFLNNGVIEKDGEFIPAQVSPKTLFEETPVIAITANQSANPELLEYRLSDGTEIKEIPNNNGLAYAIVKNYKNETEKILLRTRYLSNEAIDIILNTLKNLQDTGNTLKFKGVQKASWRKIILQNVFTQAMAQDLLYNDKALLLEKADKKNENSNDDMFIFTLQPGVIIGIKARTLAKKLRGEEIKEPLFYTVEIQQVVKDGVVFHNTVKTPATQNTELDIVETFTNFLRTKRFNIDIDVAKANTRFTRYIVNETGEVTGTKHSSYIDYLFGENQEGLNDEEKQYHIPGVTSTAILTTDVIATKNGALYHDTKLSLKLKESTKPKTSTTETKTEVKDITLDLSTIGLEDVATTGTTTEEEFIGLGSSLTLTSENVEVKEVSTDAKADKPVINIYWGSPESSTNTKVLSNLAPRKFTYQGKEYGSVEHAYQTLKSGTFDQVTYNKYVKAGGYGTKIRGKAITQGFDNLQLMRNLVVESFKQNPNQAALLLKYSDFTHTTNEVIDKAFLDGVKLAQKNAEPDALEGGVSIVDKENITTKSITIGDVTLTQEITSTGAINNTIINNKTDEGIMQVITPENKVLYAPIIGKNFVESISKYSGKNISEQTSAIFSGIKINDLLSALKNKTVTKKEESPLQKRIDPNNFNAVNNILNRATDIENYEEIELEKAKKNLKRIFGDTVGVEIYEDAKRVGSKTAHGYFFINSINLWNKAEIGTEYHEAFHAALRMFTTHDTVQALFEEARNTYPELENATELEIEEFLAEKFREYSLTQDSRSLSKKIGDTFRRLWQYIKSLFGNVEQKNAIDNYFDKLYRGKFDKTLQKKVLAPTEVYRLNTNMRPELQDRYVSGIIAHIIDAIQADTKNRLENKTEAATVKEVITQVKDLFDNAKKTTTDPTEKRLLEILLDNWNDAVDTHGNIINPGLVNMAIKKLSAYGYKMVKSDNKEQSQVNEEQDLLEEGLNTEKIYGRSHFEDSVENKLSSETKLWMASILKTNHKYFFLKEYYDLDTILKDTLLSIVDVASYEEMKDTLLIEATHKPHLKSVVEKLEYHEKTNPKLIAQFYTSMRNTYTELMMILYNKSKNSLGENYVSSSLINMNDITLYKRLLRQWKYKSKDGKTSLYEFNSEQEVYLPIQSKLDTIENLFTELRGEIALLAKGIDLTKSAELASKLLKEFNIELSTEQILSVVSSGIYVKGIKYKNEGALNRLFGDAAIVRGNWVSPMTSLVKSLKEGKDIYETNEPDLKLFAKLVQRFITEKQNSVLSAENKNIYPINLPTTFSDRMLELRNLSSIEESVFSQDPNYYPFGLEENKKGYGSFWINTAIKSSEDTALFTPMMYNATKDIVHGKSLSPVLYGDLTDKAIYENMLNLFLNKYTSNHYVKIVREFGDRGIMYMMNVPRVGNLDKASDIIINQIIQDIAGVRLLAKEIDSLKEEELLEDFHYNGKEYKQALLEARKAGLPDPSKRLFNVFKTPYAQRNKSAKPRIFDILSTINISELEDINKVRYMSENDIIDLATELYNDYVYHYIQNRIQRFKDKLVLEGLASTGTDINNNVSYAFTERINYNYNNTSAKALGIDTFNSTVESFVVSEIVNNNEFDKFLSVDVALYKDHETASKRLSHAGTPGNIQFEEVTTQEGKVKIPGASSKIVTAFIDDFFVNTELDSRQDFYKGLVDLFEEDGEKLVEVFKDTNKSDAGGTHSVREHRNHLLGIGTWQTNPELQEAYENYYGLNGKTKLRRFVVLREDKKGNIVEKDIKLKPIKPYTDALVTLSSGRVTRVIIKNASFPLLHSFAKDYEVYSDLVDMFDREGVYKDATIESVNTISTAKAAKIGINILDTTSKHMFKNLATVEFNRKDQRIPQILPETHKETLWGSQEMKAIIDNINPTSVYSINNTTLTGEEIKELYLKSGGALVDLSLNSLIEKLHIKELANSTDENRVEITKKHLTKVRKELLALMDTRQEYASIYATNLDIIYDTELGNYRFRGGLSLPMYTDKYVQLLTSIFKNKALRTKMHGDSAVQIAEFGGHKVGKDLKMITAEVIKISKKELEQEEQDKLKLKNIISYKNRFYNVKNITDTEVELVRIAKAQVALPYSIAKAFGLKPGDDLSSMPEELRTIVAYRIPTQGKNSILPLEIAYILPESMSSHILVPGEITVQMGSDFDVDKLFLMTPNISTLDGKVFSKPSVSFNKIKERGIDTYLEEFVNSPEKDSSKKKKLQNLILDINIAILTHPDHYLEVISPIDAEVYNKKNPESSISKIVEASNKEKKAAINKEIERVKNLPDSEEKDALLRILNYDKHLAEKNNLGRNDIGTELALYKYNKAAAKGISMFASSLSGNWVMGVLDNTSEIISVPTNLGVPIVYKGEELLLTDLNKNVAIDGYTKTSHFSANVGIAVDNNKDPKMIDVNSNEFTDTVKIYMNSLGMPNELANSFMTQPIIYKLSEKVLSEKKDIEDLLYEFVQKNFSKDFLETISLETLTVTTINDKELEKTQGTKKITTSNEDQQYKYLINFVVWNRQGKTLSKALRLIQPDRMRINSISKALSLLDDLSEIISKENIIGVSSLLRGSMKHPLNKSFYNVIEEMLNFVDYHIPYRQAAVLKGVSTVKQLLGKNSLSEETYKKFYEDMYLYLSAKQGSPLQFIFKEDYVEQLLLNKENNIATQLVEVKSLMSQAGRYNSLLNALEPHINNILPEIGDVKKVYKLQFNNNAASSGLVKDDLARDYAILLMDESPIISQFAKNLIHYSILTNGFRITGGSLLEIGAKYLEDINYTTYAENTIKYLNTNTTALTKFAEYFLENNTALENMFVRKDVKKEKSGNYSINKKRGKVFNVTVAGEKVEYPTYILSKKGLPLKLYTKDDFTLYYKPIIEKSLGGIQEIGIHNENGLLPYSITNKKEAPIVEVPKAVIPEGNLLDINALQGIDIVDDSELLEQESIKKELPIQKPVKTSYTLEEIQKELISLIQKDTKAKEGLYNMFGQKVPMDKLEAFIERYDDKDSLIFNYEKLIHCL